MLAKILGAVCGLGIIGFVVGHWGLFRDGLNTWLSMRPPSGTDKQ